MTAVASAFNSMIAATGGPKKPKQKLQPQQAFSDLYWDDYSVDIEKEWNLKKLAEGIKGNHGQLAHRNKKMEAIYEQQSEEVKAECIQHRDRLHEQALKEYEEQVKAMDGKLDESEESLPAEEKARLIEARRRAV